MTSASKQTKAQLVAQLVERQLKVERLEAQLAALRNHVARSASMHSTNTHRRFAPVHTPTTEAVAAHNAYRAALADAKERAVRLGKCQTVGLGV